jgi:hypothetical protein
MKQHHNNMKKIFLLFIVIVLFSCNKNLEQGEDSLTGTWNVVSAETITVNFENRLPPEVGNLGTFTFKDNIVDYFFVHNQDTILGSSPWKLKLDKVRQGFFRGNRFTLQLESYLDFVVEFEDGTTNSEKDAREIELIQDVEPNPTIDYLILKLNKQ